MDLLVEEVSFFFSKNNAHLAIIISAFITQALSDVNFWRVTGLGPA